MSHRQGELPALSTRHLTGRLRRGTGETSDNGRAAEKGGQPKRKEVSGVRGRSIGAREIRRAAVERNIGSKEWQRGSEER